MNTPKAIIVVGVLIALSVAVAIMVTNRYHVSQPFSPLMFTRFDRMLGRVEVCSSYYDATTYCGDALNLRSKEDADREQDYERQKLINYGYKQEDIEKWPENVLDGARNIIRNGGDKVALDKWINEKVPTKSLTTTGAAAGGGCTGWQLGGCKPYQ
jgi:hypothetical protein